MIFLLKYDIIYNMRLTFQECKTVIKEEFPGLDCCILQSIASDFYNDTDLDGKQFVRRMTTEEFRSYVKELIKQGEEANGKE